MSKWKIGPYTKTTDGHWIRKEDDCAYAGDWGDKACDQAASHLDLLEATRDFLPITSILRGSVIGVLDECQVEEGPEEFKLPAEVASWGYPPEIRDCLLATKKEINSLRKEVHELKEKS